MTTYIFSKWTARHISTGQIKRRLAVTGPEKIMSIGTRVLFYPLITQIDVIGTTIGTQYAAGIIFSETISADIVSVSRFVEVLRFILEVHLSHFV